MALRPKTGMLTRQEKPFSKPAPGKNTKTDRAPPKPLPDTKESAPAPAPETENATTFTFFEGAERGDANPNALYARGEATQVTEAELREYFNAQGSQMLKQAFGDFDNYLAYMTEREQLIQSGDYDVGNWDEATGALTEDQLMILGGDDLTQYSDDDQDAYTEAYGQRMQEQSAAYDNWVNSEANQALLAKYGVGSTIYNNDGDKYEWNGSAYVKTVKQDQAGLVDYVKMGIVTAMGIMTGGAVSAVAPSLGTVGSSVVSNAITQGITTGSIDPDELLQTAATAGFSQALNQVIGPELKEALNGLDISEITGIEELDNVLNAMGQTAIRQAVFDGELDMEGIVASGLLTGAQEVVEFLFSDLAGQQAISEEQQQELEERFAEYAAIVDEDTMAEVNRVMGNTVNEAIAAQQNEAMANQLQALAGNLQSIYEEAYAPTTTPYDEALADFTESTVDAAGSEFADTTDELTVDTTADAEPMQSVMYVDDQAVPADRVAEILEGSTVVTTLDGSGDYEYGPMEVGDTYLAYHTQHVDESGIEYTLIKGSDGRLYVSDGTNLVEYQGASDLTHNNAQISWLDSHLVSGGGLPTDTNNARWLNVTIDGAGTPEDSMTNRILENMEAGWQDVNNPTLESSMAAPTPDTPLETEVEVEPFEYEVEPELTPEPPPEPEPVEPVEQEQPQQGQGEEGAPTPTPVPTDQPVPTPEDPALTPEPDPAPIPPISPPPPPPPPPPPVPPPEPPPEAPPEPPPEAPPAGEAPAGEAPAQPPVDPSTGQLVTGQPSAQPVEGQPVEGQPVTGEPTSGAGQPADTGAATGQPPAQPPADPIQEAIDAATQTDVGTGQGTGVPAGEQATGQESDTPITDALFPEYATEPPPAQPTEPVPSTEPPKDEGIGVPTPVETQPPTPVEQPSEVTTESDAIALGQEAAAEERLELQQAIIAVGGDITALDESTRQQFEEFGGTVDDLFADVNVDIKALQEGQISQAEAQEAFQASVAEQFGDVTGQLGEIGGQVGGLISEVSGIGQGLEGLGEGIAGIGEGLGAGLLGLAAQQAMLPGQIAAATPIQPQKFEKFQRGLTRRKLADPLRIGMFTGGARSV